MTDLETATAHRDAWLAADLAVAQGQTYTIDVAGSRRQLTRADAAEVRHNLDYWEARIARLAHGRHGLRVRLVVPRD
jgi:hypothetical protein